MKKILTVLIVLFFVPAWIAAQNIGINATGAAPSGDAGLDVNFTNKGVLIPRVSLTNTGTYGLTGGGPTTSMLVYNTNAGIAGTGAMGVGYYYWNGTRWVKLLAASSPSEAWLTTGNAGTTAGTHFIGTTDNVSFDFRTNNVIRGRWLNTRELIIGGTSLVGSSVPNDVFTVYKNFAGVNWAVNGLNLTGDGGGGYFEGSTTSGYNVLESINNYNGTLYAPSAVFGLAIQTSGATGICGVRGTGNYSNYYGVRGNIPTTGPWLGFGGIFQGGLAYANGLYNISDARLKKNIHDISNAVEKIRNLKGVTYQYNSTEYKSAEGDNRTYFGFIAQEVEKVLPEIVAQKAVPVSSSMGSIRALQDEQIEIIKVVDYTQIIPVLVEAIKEQQRQIEQLKEEIKSLTTNQK